MRNVSAGEGECVNRSGRHVRGVVMVDDHICLMGWDMMEMKMKWNLMIRMKIYLHSVCTILHMHKVRGGHVGLMGDILAVSFTLA